MIWAALVFFVAAAALLAGVESALIGVSRVRARHAADEGDKHAARLAQMLERRHELLRAAMIAHHFCSVLAFATIAMLCGSAFGPWGIFAAAVIATPVFLVVLELAPKSLFRLYPFRTLRRLGFVLRILQIIALPGRLFARPAPPVAVAPAGDSAPGVAALVENILSLKLLPANAAALLARYANLAKLSAREIAMPFASPDGIPADSPLASLSRIPALKTKRYHPVVDGAGALIGILDAAGLPPDPAPDRLARQFAQAPSRVAPNFPALRCLQVLRMSPTPVAAMAEGDGRATGLVSLESLLERLMNISDQPKPHASSPG